MGRQRGPVSLRQGDKLDRIYGIFLWYFFPGLLSNSPECWVIFAMTAIMQNDHLTAGARVACDWNSLYNDSNNPS